ncbi:hypothetical protein MPER_13214 [Moniliophthora perniciosa FA553]|nr:hypothetical protein MPER_13214 [Moniliophthora perniciosa FA553]
MPPTPVTPSTSLPAAEHAVYDLPRPDVTVRWADHVDATFEHSQSRLRAAKLSEGEKMDKALEYILDDLGYDSLGEFSTKLFGTIVSERQRRVIRAFLQGRSSVKPIDLCKAIYDNRYSYPSYRSAHIEERQTALTATDPTTLRYARCQILCWSRILVGSRVHDEIGNLTLPSEPDAMVPSRLAASAGEHNRVAGMITVTREAILSFSIQDRISLFKREAPVSWYLTQCMAAPQKNGVVITVRKQRPPPIVSFESFICPEDI